MPPTPPPIDAAAVAALQSGDEKALERLFRAQYPALSADAMAVLEDGPAAAAAIEKIFLEYWKERANVPTADDVAGYLREGAHEAAVRLKARRAARQHSLGPAKSQGTGHAHDTKLPSVDAAWADISGKLRSTAAPSDEATRKVADLTRHDAAQHVSAMATKTDRSRIWIVAAGIVIVGLAAWWIETTSKRSAGDAALAGADAHLLQTPTGKMADVTLNDGSVTRLGPGTTLRVPSAFPAKVRTLKLEGAATFKLDTTRTMPFDLRAGNAAITATNATFEVRAFPTEKEVTVRVKEGAASVKAGKETRSLAAGASLAIAKDGTMHEPDAEALDLALGWTGGTITLKDEPLRDVLKDFDLWYGVHLVPKDSAILTRNVTLHASLDSVAKAIAQMETSAKVKFAYDGPRMIVSDAAGSAAAAKTAPAKAARKKP